MENTKYHQTVDAVNYQQFSSVVPSSLICHKDLFYILFVKIKNDFHLNKCCISVNCSTVDLLRQLYILFFLIYNVIFFSQSINCSAKCIFTLYKAYCKFSIFKC